MLTLDLKAKIHAHYAQLVQDRIDAFRDMIAALTDGAANDAKGSAGDKHETALSMMHLEQEKLNHKLAEFLAQKSILDRIDPSKMHQFVGPGSLVGTEKLTVFVSAALPKITVDGLTVFAISPESPLGSALIGKSKGAQCELNDVGYTLLDLV